MMTPQDTATTIRPVWLVRAGKDGQDEQKALESNLAMVQFTEFPSLEGLTSEQDFFEFVRAARPGSSEARNRNHAAQLNAFKERIQVGDVVVLPLKNSSHVALGRAAGPYEFRRVDGTERHVRPVEWIRKDLPRSAIGQDLRFSLGAVLTVCGIRRNDAERRFVSLLASGVDPSPHPVTTGSSTAELVPGATRFPSMDSVLEASDGSLEHQRHVEHNFRHWMTVWGALELTRRYRYDFDQIPMYWHRFERRLLSAFLADRLQKGYRNRTAMRVLTQRLFQHFDRARQANRLGEAQLLETHPLGVSRLIELFVGVARELPDFPEYGAVRKVIRGKRQESLPAELIEFVTPLDSAEALVGAEPGFYRRVPWFAYLDLPEVTQLAERQLFFAGFYGVFATSNAYVVGGSMSMAPILQNNSTSLLLGHAEQWAKGATPSATKFDVESKNGRLVASNYTTVTELFGLLNLHHQPFYNGAASVYDEFARDNDPSVTDRTRRIGELTKAFLGQNPNLVEELSERFLQFALSEKLAPPLEMEGRFDPRYDDPADDINARVANEMTDAAVERAQDLTAPERAAAMLHLVLDADIYLTSKAKSSVSVTTPVSPTAVAEPAPTYVASAEPAQMLDLPPSLQPLGNDALAYLRAGFHVLLAGAPGTGKTTLAQFVGHAWNRGLDRVPMAILLSDAPVTTVASSAWAPFHTIGGILPDESGRFRVQRGIFVDEVAGATGVWRLRPECIVLDEMNRADLDRCIGELYPLLTHSVTSVAPAGVPGVQRIVDDARFRLVATVNDATIDDIVFPISEGLARRFVRLELQGAAELEVRQFLDMRAADPEGDRIRVASEVVSQFIAASIANGLARETDQGPRLNFGVGYFALLGAWVGEGLAMSTEFREQSLPAQALAILKTSLRSATRDRGYDVIFRKLEADAD